MSGTLVDQQPAPLRDRDGEKGSDVSIKELRHRLFRRCEGQTLAEYAVIMGLITLAVVGVFMGLSGGITDALNNVMAAF
jgi:Flp pilus assembly pilin Flp